MPRVLCEWDTCRFCSEEGICEAEEVKLVDRVISGKGSMMDCKTFEWRNDE